MVFHLNFLINGDSISLSGARLDGYLVNKLANSPGLGENGVVFVAGGVSRVGIGDGDTYCFRTVGVGLVSEESGVCFVFGVVEHSVQ